MPLFVFKRLMMSIIRMAPFNCFIIVDGFECQFLRHQHFGFQEGEQRLFRRHAVIGEKADAGKRQRAENADPGHGFDAEESAQQKVQARSNAAGQDRKNELSEIETEVHSLAVIPDLTVDFDFQMVPPFGKRKSATEVTQLFLLSVIPRKYRVFCAVMHSQQDRDYPLLR